MDIDYCCLAALALFRYDYATCHVITREICWRYSAPLLAQMALASPLRLMITLRMRVFYYRDVYADSAAWRLRCAIIDITLSARWQAGGACATIECAATMRVARSARQYARARGNIIITRAAGCVLARHTFFFF